MRARALRQHFQIECISADLNIRLWPFHTPAVIAQDYRGEYLRIQQRLEPWSVLKILTQIDHPSLIIDKGQFQTKIRPDTNRRQAGAFHP